MTTYLALIYNTDQAWHDDVPVAPSEEYNEFGRAAAAVLRGGNALHSTATATTVRVSGGKGGDILTTDGPYAETKEVLTGYYLLECADLEEAVKTAAMIPAAWNGGAIEVRPVVNFG
ncbi:YciI family protein [Kutzneria sp. CA-103260]|uniref:YciI family protein n=1 Tax=Kutzneria sp. CA-103260 TaxID=2802641 RepID=UPI001BAB4EF0|nr:YciI family protein [Kutzneria sp. CA-103260]QUQ68547.1 YCII-related domain protein [Kutzneria sp. CA-103260]